MTAMQRFAWTLLAIICTPCSLAYADEWSNMFDDFDRFNEQMNIDSTQLQTEQQDEEMQAAKELFPLREDEEFDPTPDYSQSDTHVTIKVDGVPVVLDDVPVFEWFAVYVRTAADKGIISGYRSSNGLPSGTFGPADSVTIEQLAKMAVLAAGTDTLGCIADLKNEAAIGQWSEKYVRCAEAEGWAVYADGSVDLFRPATRGEVVVTVLQAFNARISPRSGTVFEDVDTSATYGAAIETAANAGVVSGYSDQFGNPTGNFGPDDSVNRAETAKIFSLSFQVYGPTLR